MWRKDNIVELFTKKLFNSLLLNWRCNYHIIHVAWEVTPEFLHTVLFHLLSILELMKLYTKRRYPRLSKFREAESGREVDVSIKRNSGTCVVIECPELFFHWLHLSGCCNRMWLCKMLPQGETGWMYSRSICFNNVVAITKQRFNMWMTLTTHFILKRGEIRCEVCARSHWVCFRRGLHVLSSPLWQRH